MPSLSFTSLATLSLLVASSVAAPPWFSKGNHGPWKGPHSQPGGPKGPPSPQPPFDTIPADSNGVNGGPFIPTGAIPTGAFPTGLIPSGTAAPSSGPADFAWPAAEGVHDFEHDKRFEGPRGRGPRKPWQAYKPKHEKPTPPVDAPQQPPFATGAPFPTGSGGPPFGGPVGGNAAPTGVAGPTGVPTLPEHAA